VKQDGERRPDLVEALDRDGLPAQLAAVDGAEPPAPQDARRREAARGGRQLRKGRRARLARERPRQRPRVCRLRALPPRPRQLLREVCRPRLGFLCSPHQPRLALRRESAERLRLAQQGSLALLRTPMGSKGPLLRLPQHRVALPEISLQLQHPQGCCRWAWSGCRCGRAAGRAELLLSVGKAAAARKSARAGAHPLPAHARLACGVRCLRSWPRT
jgi:hypothetical protein